MVRAWLLLAAALCAGCFPPELDETGRQCNERRPCAGGYACVGGRCQRGDGGVLDAGSDAGRDAGVDAGTDAGVDAGFDAGVDAGIDAGPDNYLDNPGFERLDPKSQPTAPDAWRLGVVAGEIRADKSLPHTGNFAARLSAVANNDVPAMFPEVSPVLFVPAGQRWCAEVWARTENPDGGPLPVAVSIRQRTDAGALVNESTANKPAVGKNWTLVKESYVTDVSYALDVKLYFGRPAKLNDAIYFDDARLFFAPSGVCP